MVHVVRHVHRRGEGVDGVIDLVLDRALLLEWGKDGKGSGSGTGPGRMVSSCSALACWKAALSSALL